MSRSFRMRQLLFARANRAASKVLCGAPYTAGPLMETLRTCYVDAYLVGYAAGRKDRRKQERDFSAHRCQDCGLWVDVPGHECARNPEPHIHEWKELPTSRPSIHDTDLRTTHVCECGAELCLSDDHRVHFPGGGHAG